MNENHTCQVCGKPAEKEQMFAWPEYEGRAYAVCCPLCLARFQKDPARHIGNTDVGQLKRS